MRLQLLMESDELIHVLPDNAFQLLSDKVWTAANALEVFGEIDAPVDGMYTDDSFTLRTGNAWCRLSAVGRNCIRGTFGWFGPSFEVTVKELFLLDGSSFDNTEVLADFVIVELLRALTGASHTPSHH